MRKQANDLPYFLGYDTLCGPFTAVSVHYLSTLPAPPRSTVHHQKTSQTISVWKGPDVAPLWLMRAKLLFYNRASASYGEEDHNLVQELLPETPISGHISALSIVRCEEEMCIVSGICKEKVRR